MKSDPEFADPPEPIALKIWPEYFKLINQGWKTYELREERDRNFQEGQELYLHEYAPPDEDLDGYYTGRCLTVKVLHILRHKEFPQGMKEGWCLMAIEVLTLEEPLIRGEIPRGGWTRRCNTGIDDYEDLTD